MQEEIWKPVIGYEGLYEVSSHGRVRSIDRMVKGRSLCSWLRKGKVLSCQLNKDGYFQYHLSMNNKKKTHAAHRLVAVAFIGPKPYGLECCHDDGNRENNSASNLRYGTRIENQSDRVKHGTTSRGERSSTHKLKEFEVIEIRASNLKRKEIAKKYGVSVNTVCAVRTRKTWFYLP